MKMESNKIGEKTLNSLESEVDNFDLIVKFKECIGGSYPEIEGINEIESALKNMKSYYIKETEFYDVVTLDLAIEDPYEALQNLAKSSTEFIEKVVPIDAIVPSAPKNIIDAVIHVASIKIKKEESFTVQCEFRSKYLESLNKVMNKVPCEVCRKLNLEYVNKNPDWVILIEELGKKTAIAIQQPEEILINL